MASQCYNTGITQIQDRTIDFVGGLIKVLLMQDDYTMDPDHADIAAILIAGTEAVAGGGSYARQTLAGNSITQDDANDRAVFDGTDVATFGNLGIGINIRGAIVYFDPTTGDANCVPISWNQFAADTPTNGGAFGVTWATTGIFYGQM